MILYDKILLRKRSVIENALWFDAKAIAEISPPFRQYLNGTPVI